MKAKKLISVLCAAAISASAVCGLQVYAEERYETILAEDFADGISSVVDEGAVAGNQASSVDGTLQIDSGFETFHLRFDGNASYAVTDPNKFKITFDVKALALPSNFGMGIGLGDTVRNNGAYWNFSIAGGGLAMGSAWTDSGKLYTLADTTGAEKTAAAETWYSVEAYFETPSKIMTTRAWEKDNPDTVYTRTVAAPSYGSFNVGGSRGTDINAVRIFLNGQAAIDNIKVERMPVEAGSSTLYQADFDTTGTTPQVQVSDNNPAASIQVEDGNKYLGFGSSWSRYFQSFDGAQKVDATAACNIEASFDIKFTDANRNGVGLGDGNENNGTYWIIAYSGKGASNGRDEALVIGSVENTENGKIKRLTDIDGNKPEIDPAKWYHVDSKVEFPSRVITTSVYERDAAEPVVYTASMEAPEYGNYIVGGMADAANTVSGIRYFSVGGMSVDNIQVEYSAAPFAAEAVEFNGTGVDVRFNYPISDGSAIMFNGQATAGTLSVDGKTYTFPVSGLETGTYTVTIPKGLAAENGQTTVEEAVFPVEIRDALTFAYHPFNSGTDNGNNLSLIGIGSGWASIKQDADGNYYMNATKGTAAASGDPGDWRYWSYFFPQAEQSSIEAYLKEEAPHKMIQIEFDIRSCAIPTNTERIYFSAAHQHQNGLQIMGLDANSVNMGEPEAPRAFQGIRNLEVGKWYRYTYILDVSNRRAKAALSDGTDTYEKDWVDVAGSGQGYWQENTRTPFSTLAFQLPGGDIDLDNIIIKRYYEAPVINADSIVLMSDDEIQADWGQVSTSTNEIIIDFGTTMDEATVNSDTVYITKKGDAQKVDATGAFADGNYVLTLNETLVQDTEYALCITTGVQNAAGETFGTEDYIAAFTTAAGELKAELGGVYDAEGAAVETFDAFKALGGQKARIHVSYTNTTQEAGEYNIIVAHFNGEALAGAEIIHVSKDASITAAEEDIEYTVPSDMGGITGTSIFLWDNMTDMKPLSNPIRYE